MKLLKGIESYTKLLEVVSDCGALTGSPILEQSVKILIAADEVQYVTRSEEIEGLVHICGHLDGPDHMLERKKWLAAAKRLHELRYDKDLKEWLSCPYSLLCELVDHCAGLTESVALGNANKVLAAEGQLSHTGDAENLRALLR